MDDYEFDAVREQILETARKYAGDKGVTKVVPFNPQHHRDVCEFIRELRRFEEESRKRRLLARYMVAA